MQRMARLPVEALVRVVGGPDVERRQLIDDAGVFDRDVFGYFGPGADTDTVGLRDPAVLQQGAGRGFLVRPDAFFEGAVQLGVVRGTHQVVLLVVKRGVEEEAIVLELERAAALTFFAFEVHVAERCPARLTVRRTEIFAPRSAARRR